MRRHVLASAILATLLSLPLGFVATATAPACAGAGPNHAALVVTHADGSTVSRCVAFTADTITGQQLLDDSGISWSGQSFSFGEAVCAVDGEPAGYSECLGKDRYWATFTSTSGGAWQMAMVGISDISLHDGDAEGFRYVPTTGTPDAPASPNGVCAGAGASGSPTTGSDPGSGSSGLNAGLLAAAVVAIGLLGLAVVRLVAGRRPSE